MILPDVLVIILQYLYNERRDTFSACLRVCKDWHELALPIAWKDVYLHGLEAQQFVDNVTSKSNLELIQSVTADIFKPGNVVQKLGIIAALGQRLQDMPRLISFSCTTGFPGSRQESLVANDSDRLTTPCRTDDGRRELLFVLQILPKTVQHLELSGYYFDHLYSLHAQRHICTAVARVLPQLKGLRLHDMRICPQLFQAIQRRCPLLESITINNKFRLTRCDCETDERTQEKGLDDTIDDVLAAARMVVDAGYLPRLREFVIVGFVYWGAPEVTTFQNLYKADIMNKSVTSYPCAQVHGGWQYDWWMRYKDTKTDSEVDLVAKANEFENLVEGQLWIEYESGVRLPRALQLQNCHPRIGSLSWYSGALDKADGFKNAEKPATKLFYWEERVQRSLLHVRTNSGLVVPKVILRETPLEEMQLDPDSEEGQKPKELWWIHRVFGWAQ